MALDSIWQTYMTLIVRHLINDLDGATFDDARIQEATIVAGIIANQQYDFANDYVFDLESTEITPDPVRENDLVAVALFTLKAACILSMNQYQSATDSAIRVRDGDSEIDTSAGFGGFRDILKMGPCAMYEALLKEKRILQSMNLGQAVTGPITHFDLTALNNSNVGDFFNAFRYYG